MRTLRLFLVCWVGFGTLATAQNKDYFAIISQLKSELAQLLAKSTISQADYYSIITKCNDLGKNYHLYSVEASTEGNKNFRLRNALKYYSDAAHYVDIAKERFSITSKSYDQLREKACQDAAFEYRALGNPKSPPFPEPTFYDACGLFQKDKPVEENDTNVETVHDEVSYVDEEFVTTLVGKRVFFKTPKQVFSMNVYEPFVINPDQGVMRGLMQKYAKEMQAKGGDEEQKSEFEESFPRLHWYGFDKKMGGIIFTAEANKKDETLPCQQEGGKTFSRWITVGGIKACVSDVSKHPVTQEKLESGGQQLSFLYKGELFRLTLSSGKGFNTDYHLKVLKAMIQSFRPEGDVDLPTVTYQKCVDGSIRYLTKGKPVFWRVLDESRESVLLQQPILARDYEVAGVVANYTQATLDAIDFVSDLKKWTSVPKAVLIDKKYWSTLQKFGKWRMKEKIQQAGFSKITLSASPVTAARYYMDAMRVMSEGISGIGKTINNQSMRVYWEIPIVEIKGECVPRMTCKDGKWIPDKQKSVYREISRDTTVWRAPNKAFQSLKEAKDDLNKYFYADMEKFEAEGEEYKNSADRCKKCDQSLWQVYFPIHFDVCPAIEGKLQLNQYEIWFQEQLQTTRKDEMQRWLSSLKPAEYLRLQGAMTTLQLRIDDMESELVKQKRLLEEFQRQGDTANAGLTAKKIQFLNEDIALLRSMFAESNAEMEVLKSGKRENDMSKELTAISEELIRLKKVQTDLKKELATCVKEAEKVK